MGASALGISRVEINKDSPAVVFLSFKTVLRYILLALADYNNSRNCFLLKYTFNKPITTHQETNSDLNSKRETTENPDHSEHGKYQDSISCKKYT